MARISDPAVDEEYRSLAALPLPEAAVVLDVRQSDNDSSPLLAQLNTELEDLALEMHTHKVAHWSHLHDCVALLRLTAIATDSISRKDTDFLITLPDGKEQTIMGLEFLVDVLGGDYIDRVRTVRLNIPDSVAQMPAAEGVRRSTVRVFLLADMREEASLKRAATYAHWLKTWSEREHGKSRHHRDERIHCVVLCLNADASYQDVLLHTLGQAPDSAVDTVIMLHKYSDDDAAISESAQLVYAELLLYTLILHWPDVLWNRVDDPITMHPRFMEAAQTLPWPTYLIGLAAFEYSARWSAHWLDYSVTGDILKTLNDADAIEQERPLIASNMRKWLDSWRHDLRSVVPDLLSVEIDELQGWARLYNYAHSSALSRGNLHDVAGNLNALRVNASVCYFGTHLATLQRALDDGSVAVLSQLRWLTKLAEQTAHADTADGLYPEELIEPYRRLMSLDQKLQRFPGLHFQDAGGAVPRCLAQLAALNTHARQTIYTTAQQQVKLHDYQQQFEQEAQEASAELVTHCKTWELPFVGIVFCSTLLSWLGAIALIILLLLSINWQPLLSFAGLPLLPVMVWGGRVLVILLVLGGEWMYMMIRDRSLRHRCQAIEARLGNIIVQHLTEVGDVVAARVGLSLLEQANLYASGKTGSPYEERLQEFVQVGKRAEAYVRNQRTLAESRLHVDSSVHIAKSASAAVEDEYAHTELINWTLIEEAFLESCKSLHSPTINMLAEMLLRQLGTERPLVMLDDIWQKNRWVSSKDKEMRYQTLSTLLVALLLVSPVAQPRLADVLTALQEYTTLKTRLIKERIAPAEETIEVATIIKNTLLAQARGNNRFLSARNSEQRGLSALVAWVNAQHEVMPQLREVFATHDLLEQVLLNQLQPSLILNALYKRGKLLGYPDEISGEDSYYLFATQGTEIAYATFLETLDNIDYRRLQVVAFPDREKLVYLRIHRVRQNFSHEDGAAARSQHTDDSTRIHPIGIFSAETAHQED